MNSSVWAVWADQGSKKKSGSEVFCATFEGDFFNFLGQKKYNFCSKNIVVSAQKSCIK
jgi:hypothetical protein